MFVKIAAILQQPSILRNPGASVAQWSERLPFTPEVAGSILSENVLNVTRTQCFAHVRRVSQHSAESCGLTGWVRINTAREVKSQLL